MLIKHGCHDVMYWRTSQRDPSAYKEDNLRRARAREVRIDKARDRRSVLSRWSARRKPRKPPSGWRPSRRRYTL